MLVKAKIGESDEQIQADLFRSLELLHRVAKKMCQIVNNQSDLAPRAQPGGGKAKGG